VSGAGALYGLFDVISVEFADPRSVHAIERASSAAASLKSFRLPVGVRRVHGLAFYDVRLEAFSVNADHPHFRFDGGLLIERGTDRAVCCSSRRPVRSVPSSVRILGKWPFGFCTASRSAVTFSRDSRLASIERFVFASAGVVWLTLPRELESVDGSAFEDSQLHTVAVGAGNAHFEMRDGFLVGVRDRRLVRYFGRESDVVVPREIAVLGPSCFSRCPNIASI
jgi:hypothetical protein